MMLLDDFVMLGKTVPEPTRRDGRIFVCSAGVSETLRSLVRIYPLARRGTPARWAVCTVKLIRNAEDNRAESFKLDGDRRPGAHEDINHAFDVNGVVQAERRRGMLDRYVLGSIKEANAKRVSLAVIHPERQPELTFEHNPESPDSPELTLFDLVPRPTQGAKRFAYIPRLRFEDEDGTHHLMLRDWGCFEFMRKQGDHKRFQLPDALHIGPDSSLLVGNFNQHRNAWFVISVLNGIRTQDRTLLDELESVK